MAIECLACLNTYDPSKSKSHSPKLYCSIVCEETEEERMKEAAKIYEAALKENPTLFTTIENIGKMAEQVHRSAAATTSTLNTHSAATRSSIANAEADDVADTIKLAELLKSLDVRRERGQ